MSGYDISSRYHDTSVAQTLSRAPLKIAPTGQNAKPQVGSSAIGENQFNASMHGDMFHVEKMQESYTARVNQSRFTSTRNGFSTRSNFVLERETHQ